MYICVYIQLYIYICIYIYIYKRIYIYIYVYGSSCIIYIRTCIYAYIYIHILFRVQGLGLRFYGPCSLGTTYTCVHICVDIYIPVLFI